VPVLKTNCHDKLLFTIYRLKNLVSNSILLDIVFPNGHCSPWWWYTCTTNCQRWYLYVINTVHLFDEINGVYGCFGNWICFWLKVEREEHVFIHLGTLKGANINYWCSGCACKKLWGWTVSKLMAMFTVPFCGNYGCDITGWLQINEQFGGPVSSYWEHMNNFFTMKGSPQHSSLFLYLQIA